MFYFADGELVHTQSNYFLCILVGHSAQQMLQFLFKLSTYTVCISSSLPIYWHDVPYFCYICIISCMIVV